MIVIAGQMHIDPARRDEFVEATADIVRHTRAEPGCIDYAFSADPLDPGVVRIVEVYETAAALESHRNADYHEVFVAALPHRGVQGYDITEYEIAKATPLAPKS